MEKSFKVVFIIIIVAVIGSGAYFYYFYSHHFKIIAFKKNAISVSELLEHPVYEKEIKIYGEVGDLGKLLCPCFRLVFGARAVDVWYDSMLEHQGKQRPKVNIEKINNGDWIFIKGELKSTEGLMPSNTFWASKIEK